jgi:hypothetical protein
MRQDIRIGFFFILFSGSSNADGLVIVSTTSIFRTMLMGLMGFGKALNEVQLLDKALIDESNSIDLC